ncbi:MAG: hypothetical protein P1U57_05785, partial [Oleibacter sp.]|nr:hypothetical protein [Thalassolituus sp.]
MAMVISMMANASSPLFDGNNSGFWVVDSVTGKITSYASSSWIDAYQSSLYATSANEQVLVNSLPKSSVAMLSPTNGVSLIGLDVADKNKVDGDSGVNAVYLTPDSGMYEKTINVSMELDVELLGKADITVRWRSDGGEWETISDTTKNPIASIIFIRNGTHFIDVEVRDNTGLIDTKNSIYTINNDDKYGDNRDTDGDGIPDLIEQLLGLDPLNADANKDTDKDGWSDFDTWIRCGVTFPKCTAMNDTDGDGWIDFDEKMRGTRSDDPIVTLANVDKLPDGTYNQLDYAKLQRFREYPAARRLYEKEYLSKQTSVVTATTLMTTTAAGGRLWQTNDLLTANDLSAAQISAADVAPSLIMDNAVASIKQGTLPDLRLPSSSGVFMRWTLDSGTRLHYLPIMADINFVDFMAVAGEWTDPEKWRQSLIDWLTEELTVDIDTDLITDNSSLSWLMLEQSFRLLADLRNEDSTLRLGHPDYPMAWITDWLDEYQDRFKLPVEDILNQDQFELLPEDILNKLAITVSIATKDNNSLADDATQFQQWTSQWPKTQDLTEWLTDRLYNDYKDRLEGCYISDYDLFLLQENDYLDEFLDDCPVYHTGSDVSTQKNVDENLRYRLLLSLLPGSLDRLENNVLLGESRLDLDEDGLSNIEELTLFPFSASPLPWRADSDNDDELDGSDLCPLDQYDRCLGFERANTLRIGDEELSITRLPGETTALVTLELDRPATSAICLIYSINSLSSNVSFSQTETRCFAPEQRVLLIPISLPADPEDRDTVLELSINSFEGEVKGNSSIQIEFTGAVAELFPRAIVKADREITNERELVTLNGDDSTDSSNSELQYEWRQISGPIATINDPMNSETIIILPNVLSSEFVVFELTVTNKIGNSDSENISIQVNPVQDPPFQLTTPRYQLTAGSNTTILWSDLNQYVVDPDGDSMIFSTPSGIPESITVKQLSNGYEFELANTGELSLSTRASRNLVPWADGVAWIELPGINNLPPQISSWRPSTGTSILYKAPNTDISISNILSNSKSEEIYFDGYDLNLSSGIIFWLSNSGNGSVINNGFYGLFSSVIGHLDQLYTCGNFNTWELLDKSTSSFIDTNIQCESYSSSSLILQDRSCLISPKAIACTMNDGSTELSNLYAVEEDNANIFRLLKFNEKMLMLTSISRESNGIFTSVVRVSELDNFGNEVIRAEIPTNSFDSKYVVIGNTFLM